MFNLTGNVWEFVASDGGDAIYAQHNGQNSVSGRGYDGATGVLYIAYKGPQRGEGGTIDQTSRVGYTIHKFLTVGSDLFIGWCQ